MVEPRLKIFNPRLFNKKTIANVSTTKKVVYNTGISPLIEKLSQQPNAFFQFILKETPVKEAVSSTYLTKCYNTATTLLYLLTLNKKALDKADVICHDNLYNKPLAKNQKLDRLKELKKNLAKKERGIVLYYILMNVGDMNCAARSNNNNFNFFGEFNKTKTFPGHVFIVEKVGYIKHDGKLDMKYFLYQSYINKYTLKDYYHKNGNSFEIKQQTLLSYIDGMIYLFEKEKWDQKTSDFWKDFTLVNSSDFNKCEFTRVKPCYLRFKMRDIKDVLKNYEVYLSKKVKEVNSKIKLSNLDYYKVNFNVERNQFSNITESANSANIHTLKEYLQNLKKVVREIKLKVKKK